MFMVLSKDRIVSYLISLSTVMILFVMSFVITKSNNEILKTSTNAVPENENTQETSQNTELEEEVYNQVINGNITNTLQK